MQATLIYDNSTGAFISKNAFQKAGEAGVGDTNKPTIFEKVETVERMVKEGPKQNSQDQAKPISQTCLCGFDPLIDVKFFDRHTLATRLDDFILALERAA